MIDNTKPATIYLACIQYNHALIMLLSTLNKIFVTAYYQIPASYDRPLHLANVITKSPTKPGDKIFHVFC